MFRFRLERPRGGGRGGRSIKFYTGRLRSEVQTLTFNMLIFTKMIPLSYTWSRIAPLSYTSRLRQNNRISCNRHVFPRFSVVLIQLRSHFCQDVAPFDTLCFSHNFFHFAADFVTLSYTKMAIFPTL